MKKFNNILCVVDSETDCKPALERAIALAGNNQASLTVVNVIEHDTPSLEMLSGGFFPADLRNAMVNGRKQALEALVNPYLTQVNIKTKVLTGIPFLQIIHEVLRNGYDLVIKIPENQDLLNRLFGSNDMHLLRKCPCPVWLIKPQATKSNRRILVAIDVNDAYPMDEKETRNALNLHLLEVASSLALSEFAELHIGSALEAFGVSTMRGPFVKAPEEDVIAYIDHVRRQHEARLDALMCEITNILGRDAMEYLKPRTHLVRGSANKEIPELAKRIKAELVVMGTVARTGIPGFIMGNTAETILNQIDCSVLAIKPPGFITPVTLA